MHSVIEIVSNTKRKTITIQAFFISVLGRYELMIKFPTTIYMYYSKQHIGIIASCQKI